MIRRMQCAPLFLLTMIALKAQKGDDWSDNDWHAITIDQTNQSIKISCFYLSFSINAMMVQDTEA